MSTREMRGVVARWRDERVRSAPGSRVTVRELYDDYRRWARLHAVPELSGTVFGMYLTAALDGLPSTPVRDPFDGRSVRVRRDLSLVGVPVSVLHPPPRPAPSRRSDISFVSYMRLRHRERSPVGTLADDLVHDRDVRCSMSRAPMSATNGCGDAVFGTDPCRQPEPSTFGELVDYLRWHGAGDAALEAAAAAWTDYLRWRSATPARERREAA